MDESMNAGHTTLCSPDMQGQQISRSAARNIKQHALCACRIRLRFMGWAQARRLILNVEETHVASDVAQTGQVQSVHVSRGAVQAPVVGDTQLHLCDL